MDDLVSPDLNTVKAIQSHPTAARITLRIQPLLEATKASSSRTRTETAAARTLVAPSSQDTPLLPPPTVAHDATQSASSASPQPTTTVTASERPTKKQRNWKQPFAGPVQARETEQQEGVDSEKTAPAREQSGGSDQVSATDSETARHDAEQSRRERGTAHPGINNPLLSRNLRSRRSLDPSTISSVAIAPPEIPASHQADGRVDVDSQLQIKSAWEYMPLSPDSGPEDEVQNTAVTSGNVVIFEDLDAGTTEEGVMACLPGRQAWVTQIEMCNTDDRVSAKVHFISDDSARRIIYRAYICQKGRRLALCFPDGSGKRASRQEIEQKQRDDQQVPRAAPARSGSSGVPSGNDYALHGEVSTWSEHGDGKGKQVDDMWVTILNSMIDTH